MVCLSVQVHSMPARLVALPGAGPAHSGRMLPGVVVRLARSRPHIRDTLTSQTGVCMCLQRITAISAVVLLVVAMHNAVP